MESINSIINFSKHPINDLNYIQECHSLIKKNSLLILENFLLDKSLTNMLNEAKQLEGKAFYCEQQHTILLSKTSNNFDDKDPLNRPMTSDKGCIPHDLINHKSDLNILYHSDIFKSFIKNVLHLDNIFPYADSFTIHQGQTMSDTMAMDRLGFVDAIVALVAILLVVAPKKAFADIFNELLDFRGGVWQFG